MKIAIGADHRGFEHKKELLEITTLANIAIEWIDVGSFNAERSDYPVYSDVVCHHLLNGTADAGILLCGSGVGMSIAANRFEKIYAALVWNVAVAQASKEDDNANILVFASDYNSAHECADMLAAWLGAQFKQGRYQERLEMIDRK